MAIYPPEDPIKREYSIGKIKNNIFLSIKLHSKGICSNYLFGLNHDDVIKAELIVNDKFHYPKKDKIAILIANGTGIAPFLGMLYNPGKKYLYWGGKSKKSFQLYEHFLNSAKGESNLIDFKSAFSREKGKKRYVQNLVERDAKLILSVLENGGTLMLCGSVQMQNDVLSVLGRLCEKKEKQLNHYQMYGQLLMDCY